MYNYSVNMACWPTGGLARWGPSSVNLTSPVLYGTVGASNLTLFLAWEISYFHKQVIKVPCRLIFVYGLQHF